MHAFAFLLNLTNFAHVDIYFYISLQSSIKLHSNWIVILNGVCQRKILTIANDFHLDLGLGHSNMIVLLKMIFFQFELDLACI